MKLSKYFNLLKSYLFYQKYYRRTTAMLNDGKLSDKSEIDNYQYNKLKEIIEYAYINVPYYTELFDSVNFRPGDFKTLTDIKKIPYLAKNLVQENQEKFISKSFNRKNVKIAETGGTTGLPMTFWLDKRTSSLIEMAYLTDMWKRVNYKRYDRCIVLREDAVEKIIPGKKYWKMNRLTNWLIMSSFHLNADTFPLYYKKIMAFKPLFILAFPSNAYLLARFIKENNLPGIPSLKGIICSSENMYDWQRDYMEEIFKVRVFSYYGHSEKCVIAGECSDSRLYEFYPQYGFVELINQNNEYCTEEGEIGEIVATGFNNLASPFIRYRTNDLGIYTKKRGCEHSGWLTIERIEGRKQDFIIDSDGTPKTSIHIDRPFWKIRNEIYSYQYIQSVPGKVEVHVHSKADLTNEQVSEIKKIFLETYFKFDIEVKQVDTIPRTKSGKFRYLVQNIKNF